MILDPEICYRALQTRDARFDGRFFTAVRSTGVYCRPICPARTPRREHCLFVPCAAAAQEAGYRPCLRCRPEASPGTPAWLGTSATVSRALRLIEQGCLETEGLLALADRLGVGGRHLRRLFQRHLGASPLAVAQARRALFAKKLIDETRLPMSQIAFAAGFSSVRRFNAAIRATYRRTPSELRRTARPSGENGPLETTDLSLVLSFRPPFHWRALIRFLAARATPGVEVARPDLYRRSVRVAGTHGIVEVRPVPGAHALRARVRLSAPFPLIHVAERLRGLFDLGADPAEIEGWLGRDPRLRPALRALPGLRVPGAWDGFELAVRAILGQQVSVRGATTLAGRLVECFGEPLAVEDDAGEEALRRIFPGPERLARADVARIGIPRSRARAIAALAAAVESGELALDASADPGRITAALSRLPGVGAWTAAYVAMRALREPDAFPASDLGLRRALARDATPLSATALERAAEAWRPWRAYAAMLLWSAPPQRLAEPAGPEPEGLLEHAAPR